MSFLEQSEEELYHVSDDDNYVPEVLEHSRKSRKSSRISAVSYGDVKRRKTVESDSESDENE